MANYGDFRGVLEAILVKLKQISHYTNPSECCAAITSGGTGALIPAGFNSISITQTSAGAVNVTLSDGSVFPLTASGQVFTQVAGPGKFLPAYTISTTDGATWKWAAIK